MTGPDPTTAALTVPNSRRVSPLVIVAAVVSLVLIGAAALVASLYAPAGRDSSIITAFVLGTIAPTTVGLLALVRGDHAAILGQANARRLVATAAKVEQVAENVNGHLERHDALAGQVMEVADRLANSATPLAQIGRQSTTRSRSTDTDPDGPGLVDPGAADSQPLAPDQS